MSECEIPEFYFHSDPVARKSHECAECAAPINPGEKHFRVNMKYDGRLESFRQHFLCMEACMFVRDKGLNDDECLGYGELREWYWEWHQDNWNEDIEVRKRLWLFILNIKRRERLHEKSTRAIH